MKHLILHIGMHKTGTTSIQKALYRNRRALAAHGFDYLNVCENHSHLFQTLYGSRPERQWHNILRGYDTPEKALQRQDRLRRKMLRIFKKTKTSNMIVSGEALSTMTEENIARIKATLDEHFDKITIIGFVRPPAGFITSLSQQQIRVGRGTHRTLRTPPLPEYRYKFEKFFHLFGRENVKLVLYDPRGFVKQCAVAEFLSRIGVPESFYDSLKIRRRNESLSLTAAKILLVANDMFPRTVKGKFNDERPRGLARMVSKIGGPKFQFSRSCLLPILEEQKDDIKWMEDTLNVSFSETLSDDVTATYDFGRPWRFGRTDMQYLATFLKERASRLPL